MNQPLVLQVGHAPGNLSAPVEEGLGPDLVLVVPHVVKKTSQGHQLGDEHHLGGHAHRKKLQEVGVFHRGHNVSLVQNLVVGGSSGALVQDLKKMG